MFGARLAQQHDFSQNSVDSSADSGSFALPTTPENRELALATEPKLTVSDFGTLKPNPDGTLRPNLAEWLAVKFRKRDDRKPCLAEVGEINSFLSWMVEHGFGGSEIGCFEMCEFHAWFAEETGRPAVHSQPFWTALKSHRAVSHRRSYVKDELGRVVTLESGSPKRDTVYRIDEAFFAPIEAAQPSRKPATKQRMQKGLPSVDQQKQRLAA